MKKIIKKVFHYGFSKLEVRWIYNCILNRDPSINEKKIYIENVKKCKTSNKELIS